MQEHQTPSMLLLRGQHVSTPLHVDPRDLDDATATWGSELWSGQITRESILAEVRSGLSLRSALSGLTAKYGRMPTEATLYRWMEKYGDFKEDYKAAVAARGELMAEAALETALAVRQSDPAVAIKHLQWHAAKLNKKTYGENSTVDVAVTTAETMTDEQIDKRIQALMSNKALMKTLPYIDVTPEEEVDK